MRIISRVISIWLAFALHFGIGPAAMAQGVASPRGSKSTLIMAHYMAWFESKPVSQQWGWHWTMAHYDPEKSVAHGGGSDPSDPDRRQAASQYYPLIGLYDSSDPYVLEYQVQLMKLSGIDGVLIDWYGTDDLYDYALNHRNAIKLIDVVKRAGMKFAIVYEDSTIPKLIAAGKFSRDDSVNHCKTMLRWMQDHWFSDDAYVKIDGRPVLLVFGAGYLKTEDWNRLFDGLSPNPELYTESDLRAPASGAYDWPSPGSGIEKGLQNSSAFLERSVMWPHAIPCAYPRFDDIYEQAGVQKSWGHIDDNSGKTYAVTLEQALKAHAAVTQIATWNDWGEGTQIEPSVEFGNRDLETTQRLRREYVEMGFGYSANDLTLPRRLYLLRKSAQSDAERTRLNAVSAALLTGKPDRARMLLEHMGRY